MKTFFTKKLLLIATFYLMSHYSMAQNERTDWYKMIQEPDVNFFEAKKAYELYYSTHSKEGAGGGGV